MFCEMWLEGNTFGFCIVSFFFIWDLALTVIFPAQLLILVILECHVDTLLINMHETPKISAEGHCCTWRVRPRWRQYCQGHTLYNAMLIKSQKFSESLPREHWDQWISDVLFSESSPHIKGTHCVTFHQIIIRLICFYHLLDLQYIAFFIFANNEDHPPLEKLEVFNYGRRRQNSSFSSVTNKVDLCL